MKLVYFFLFLSVLSTNLMASAAVSPIDGSYGEVALRPESYDFTKFTVVLKDGQMIITDQLEPTHPAITSHLNILPGGQADFVKSLPNGIPAGIMLYQTSIDFQNSGQSTPVTIVQQSLDNTSPRLTFYIMQNGQAVAVIKLYDSAEAEAFEAAWKATQN